MEMLIVTYGWYTRYPHSVPFLMNGPIQFLSGLHYMSYIIVALCCMNSTILFQKTVAISFLAGKRCLFELFWLSIILWRPFALHLLENVTGSAILCAPRVSIKLSESYFL
jgi:hypothetical protein